MSGIALRTIPRSSPCPRPAFVLLLLVIGGFFGPRITQGALPDWIESGLEKDIPAEFADADAVQILNHAFLTYDTKGRVREHLRGMVKIQNEAGSDRAQFEFGYNGEADRVRELDAYLIRPNRKPDHIRKKECAIIEVGSAGGLFTEKRAIAYDASDEVEAGSYFAYEITIDRKSYLADTEFYFNMTIPVLSSLVRIELPDRWELRFKENRMEDTAFGHRRTENSWSWSAHHLPAMEETSWSESYRFQTSYLLVMIEPSTDAALRYPLLSWKEWTGVASFIESQFDGLQSNQSSIRDETEALVEGLETTGERIRAIARFVQSLKYVALSIDLANGGGFRPRPAEETLRTRYGDCKDKANLMCAMLRAIDLRAFPVTVLIDWNKSFDSAWPSPGQFNHCIVAIAQEDPAWSAQVEHAYLGPLLIFDPTDENTPPGWLKDHLADEYGLLGTQADAPLIKFPVISAEDYLTERQIEASFTENGTLEAQLKHRSTGLASAFWRRQHRSRTPSELEDYFARRLRDDLRQVNLHSLAVHDSGEMIELESHFTSPAYARLVGQRMLIFQPCLIGRREWVPPEDESRTNGIRFDASREVDHFTFALPENHTVMELPPPVSLETDFLTYTTSVEIIGDTLHFHRTLEWYTTTVSAADYAELRAAYATMREGDSASVILGRR